MTEEFEEFEISDEYLDGLIEGYVAIGILISRGVDPVTGEQMYSPSPDAETLAPEFFKSWTEYHAAEIDEALLRLVEGGLLEFEYPDETLEPVFRLTEKGRLYAESMDTGQEGDRLI